MINRAAYRAEYYARNKELINARARARRAKMTDAERERDRERQKTYARRARAKALGLTEEEYCARLERLAERRRRRGEKPEGMSEYVWLQANMTEAERKAFRARRREYEKARRARLGTTAGATPRDDIGRRVEAISPDELARAKTKPANCSAVRWRMELSRRRMSRACTGKMPYYLPNPDRLGRGGRIAGMPMV